MTAAITPLLAFASTVAAGSDASQTRLVVSIIVEGLTTDGLDEWSSKFSANGLNRFLNHGLVIRDVDYSSASDRASAVATITTGSLPAVNGIGGESYFDREAMLRRNVMYDKDYLGNATNESLSPIPLKVTNIADELKISTDGLAKIYSIAPDAASAIITGGHSANAAIWINDIDGRWASSTYYKDLPSIVSEANYRYSLSSRIDTISWNGSSSNGRTFRYLFPKKDKDRYLHLISSPRVNDEISLLADKFIALSAKESKPGAPGMVNIVYTISEYPDASSSSTLKAEEETAYRKLDAQVAKILKQIETTVGLSNAVIYIAGVPANEYRRAYETKWNIPGGEFSPKKARALLNMYLIALHGNGNWVVGYDNFQFYLNNTLAEQKGITPSDLHRQAADFLLRMSGVTNAETVGEYLASQEKRKSINAKTAGDVFVSVNPGWKLTETDNPQSEGKTLRASIMSAPFLMLAPNYSATTISTPVDATTLAPTISRAIRIRAPNASASPAVSNR